MSIATLSSTQPVSKVLNPPPSFGPKPTCQKPKGLLLSLFVFLIPASTKKALADHISPVLEEHWQGLTIYGADYIDNRSWFPRSDRVAANYPSHQIVRVEIRSVNPSRPGRSGGHVEAFKMYHLNQTKSRSASEIWKVIRACQSELTDRLEVTGCLETVEHVKHTQLDS